MNLPTKTIRLAAAYGEASEPTVRKVLAGLRVQPVSLARVLRGLRQAGVPEDDIATLATKTIDSTEKESP
jgi:hypothetical protein